MVSPVTIIHETSNSNDDEIVFTLNINLSIDIGVDCDPEKSKIDASATTTNTIEEGAIIIDGAAASVEEAAKSIIDEAAAVIDKVANNIIEEVTPKKQPSPPKKQPSPPKKQPSSPKKQPSPPKKQPSPPRRRPSPPRRQPSPPADVVKRIYIPAASHLSLCVRGGEAILANSNAYDKNQQWFVYERFSTGVKDRQGKSSFIMMNIGSGLTLQHATGLKIGINHRVPLKKHNLNEMDRSVLWTSQYFSKSSITIRSVNDTDLELCAINANGYHDGNKVRLYNTCHTGTQQYWNIIDW